MTLLRVAARTTPIKMNPVEPGSQTAPPPPEGSSSTPGIVSVSTGG